MKLLVTGGTGLVGSNVIKVAQETYGAEVTATLFQTRPDVAWGVPTIPMDLEEPESIRTAVRSTQPDAVIHCAAVRDEDRLEVDHDWGWSVMATSTDVMARACREVGAKLVFVSSDWVFGKGGQPPYDEVAPPCPANYFGLLKVIGETTVASVCEDYANVRIASVYGPNWSFPQAETSEEGIGMGWLANYYVYRLARGLPVVVWGKHISLYANPSLASDVADSLLTIVRQDQRGLFHCCGRDGVSRLELARAVAGAFDFDAALVRAATDDEMDLSRLEGKLFAPPDSRLRVDQSEARLGRVNVGLREGLREYRRQLADIAGAHGPADGSA
jgi:dTDP-4-dehydrorhamnose reductase